MRGVLAELLFAFLQRDGVDDALALQALQAGLDDLPLGGVHHEGHLGDLGLAAEQLQVAGHGGDAVDHALVHADVDDVGAVLDLLARDADRFFVLAFLDQLGELRRTGDVGPLADHDVDAGLLGEGLRSGQAERLRLRGHAHALLTLRLVGSSSRGACPSSALAMAAMCSGVLPQQPPAMLIRPPLRKVAEITGHVRRAQIEAGWRERIRQAGVRVAGDGHVRFLGELFQEWIHQIGAERAVQADGERLHVLDRVPEGLGGLRGDQRLAATADGCGDHDRQFFAVLIEDLADGDERGLGVERVEDGLDQKQVGAAGDEGAHLLARRRSSPDRR